MTRGIGKIRKPATAAGSVSVYFITATAAFVLLSALLIDFARIAAFRQQAELAAQAGVRSVLSSFDSSFHEKYGLFIRGGEDGQTLFRDTLDGHFISAAQAGSLNYLKSEWLDAGVTESRPLAEHTVFRRQVMEEMKYKAPIDLTLEVGQRFRGMSAALKETSRTVNQLESVRQAYDRRESSLNELLSIQRHAGEEMISRLQEFEVDPAASASDIRHIGEAFDQSVKDILQRALSANEEMRAISAEVSGQAESGATETDGAVSLAEIRQTADSLILQEPFFHRYREELSALKDSGMNAAAEIDRYAAMVSNGDGTPDTHRELTETVGKVRSVLNAFVQSYGTEGSVIRNRLAVLGEHRSHDEERKSLETAARNEWSGWTRLNEGLNGQQGTRDDRESFREADKLAHANLVWNRGEASDQHGLPGADQEPAASVQQAVSGSAEVLNILEAALSGTRDSMFLSEYLLTRFSHLSPSAAKKSLTGEQTSLSLDSQEAEYVLYGLPNPTGNIAAVYGEIFAFRLAVRMLEGLVERRSLGHPLLILAAALVYGVHHAVQDIQMLLDRGTVPLSKYMKTETRYEDYLRLFLLFHGGSPGHLSRMIAVMEHATGYDLKNAFTYVSGQGTASLKLWFFPGLLKLMNRTGRLGGAVKGNRYEAVYQADSSYQ